MEKLATLPFVGPFFAWLFRTRVWAVYEHLDRRKWARLSAAITYASFLALFPMILVGAAIGAAFLTPTRVRQFQDFLADQVPGISGQLDLQALVDHAGTLGLIAGAMLLVTGVGWVATLRECLRTVWDLEEDPGNPVLLRVKDFGVLLGLGAVGLVSMAGSAFSITAVRRVSEWMGLAEGGLGDVLLRVAAYAAAIAASFLLLWYVLTVLPRVRPARRSALLAALFGAVGFELLKLLLGGYLKEVAAKNMYGAFGVPVALLLWLSLVTRLLLVCAAWTATEPTDPTDPAHTASPEPSGDDPRDDSDERGVGDERGEGDEHGRRDEPAEHRERDGPGEPRRSP
ncbi:YihY/virulence factor BrkB family protein [Streptomyces sp. AJS327]|uniref:YihY/virulence factor BrkB family protein n=1 Tax=Streptomyces sp. AJS327 TaxID=2545265 RepID=UPI0015E0356A|nr:YihY/virulence factor BrkB family protein [Streptomyces sp. AJS327]MBA0054162.1 YihY/virulence factor BrkB family protein [Streptomyces sp. AJS327]